MTNADDLPTSVTVPYDAFDHGITLTLAIVSDHGLELDFDDLVNEVLSMNRDARFTESVNEVQDEFTAVTDAFSTQIGVELADKLTASIQRELFFRALLSSDATDHMVLAAGLQIVRENLGLVGDAPNPEELWSSLIALGARLYRCTQNRNISDKTIRDFALAEYHGYNATEQPLERHPDTVAPEYIRADLRVYGALLAYTELGLPLEYGANFADEGIDDFGEILADYGIENEDQT